jgi:hypothetical protein
MRRTRVDTCAAKAPTNTSTRIHKMSVPIIWAAERAEFAEPST